MKSALKITIVKWLPFFIGLCLSLLLSSCGKPPVDGGGNAKTVYLNERVQLVFSESTGAATLTLNGKSVANATFSSSSVYFDVTLETLGGTYTQDATAVVTVGGKEVLKQPLTILQTELASSDLVVYTQGYTRADLEAALAKLNADNGLGNNGFKLNADSFQSVDKSDTGTALINIGQQSTSEANKRLNTLAASGSKAVTSSPNLSYGISGRNPMYWTSPRCDVVDELTIYADDTWKSLKREELFALLHIDTAQASGYKGAGVILPIIDTGLETDDVFDCPNTPFVEGHGTHVYTLAKAAATEATVGSEPVCSKEGFCSTAQIIQQLIDLENRYLVVEGQKVIVNLSLSGGKGLNDSIDQAIWKQLDDYQTRYPDRFLAIAAAGNYGISDDATINSTPAYPASFSDAVTPATGYTPLHNVISVGTVGVRASDNKVTVSATNPKGVAVDVLAPGIRLCLAEGGSSCAPDNTTEGLTGSSFATGIVSGVAAMMWSACPTLTAQELKELMKSQGTAVDGTSYKLINADPSFKNNSKVADKCGGTPSPSEIQPGTTQTGTLSNQQTREYTFDGFNNTPVVFTLTAKSGLQVSMEIFDFRDQRVLHSGFNYEAKYPFTPKENEKYKVKLTGIYGPGSYTISNEYVAGKDRPNPRVLEPSEVGTQLDGVLAQDAFDEFTFTGSFNTPVLFTVVANNGLQLSLQIYKPNGQPVFSSGFGYNAQYPFTPLENGEYKAKLTAIYGPGSYTITNEYVAGPPPERNIVKPIILQQLIEGTLAEDAFDEYSFTGSANTPLLFTINAKDGLQLKLEISKDGQPVFSSGFGYNVQHPFTPQENGEYRAKLTAIYGPGAYTLFVENPTP
jgi:hypothetical protein